MPDAPGPDQPGRRFLTSLRLADSLFPAGSYAHPQGLESMAPRRRMRDADGVAQYLRNLLPGSILPAAGVALRNAHAAGDADMEVICEIDRHLYAMKLPAERRLASAAP